MSEAGPRVNGPASPTGKYIDGIDPDDPQYIKNLQRPAEVKEDLQQMENRSRVSVILNSQAFKDELEQVVEEQLRNGPYPASLIALQQITDLLLPQSKGSLASLARASSVIPINDLRGVESLNFAKGEKLLRCKVASLYRLVDLCGWSHGIHNHISARVSPESEHFLLNPFGLTYSEITASSLVKVDVNGDIVEPGSTYLGVNKAGFSVHSAIHQARPDIKCIVHLHTPSAVAVSALKCGLLAMSQEALICGNVSYHDFHGVTVDADERERLARNLGVHNKILILRNRGVLACGETVEEAFHFTFNVMAACETQVKAMPVGLDNIVIPSAAAREQTHRVANQGGGGVDSTGRKWKIGELEFEALMRTLDNSGFRTGHVYKMPIVKQEKKERSNSEVEIPPASSSFTYIFDGDYEHSKYASPVKAAMERQKKAYKAGWLTTPNAYKKKEVDEIGTTTPKKITKWVPETDSPNRPGGAIVKIENPNQFAPQGENPKEFKEKQKSIKKDYYEERITAGPQSKILEGLTWDEAQRAKDGQLSGAGDQLIVVGAASKGIIQRDHQHNAVVYRQYYAANPFENMSEAEIDAYQAEVQRRERGELETSIEEEIEPPVEEVPKEAPPTPRAPEPEIQEPEVRYTRDHDNTRDTPVTSRPRQSQGYSVHEEKMLAQLAETVVQSVIHDALSAAHQGKGQQILIGAGPLRKHQFLDYLSLGSHIISHHRNMTTHCKLVQPIDSCIGYSDDKCSDCPVRSHTHILSRINQTFGWGNEESMGSVVEEICLDAGASCLHSQELTSGQIERGSYLTCTRFTMRGKGEITVEVCRGVPNEEFRTVLSSRSSSCSCKQHCAAGCSCEQHCAAGCSCEQHCEAGCSCEQHCAAGCCCEQHCAAGCSCEGSEDPCPQYSLNMTSKMQLPVIVSQQPIAQEPAVDISSRTNQVISHKCVDPRPDSDILLSESRHLQAGLRILPSSAVDASVNLKTPKRGPKLAGLTRSGKAALSFDGGDLRDNVLTTTAGSARYKNLLVIDEEPDLAYLPQSNIILPEDILFRLPGQGQGKCPVALLNTWPFDDHKVKSLDSFRDTITFPSPPNSADRYKKNPIDSALLSDSIEGGIVMSSESAFENCNLMAPLGFMSTFRNICFTPPEIMVYPVSRVGMPPRHDTRNVQRSSEMGLPRQEAFHQSPTAASRSPGRGRNQEVADFESTASKRWTPKSKNQRRQLDLSLDENVSVISEGTRREEKILLERSFGRQGQQDMDPDENKLDSLRREEALRKAREEKRAKRNEEARIIYEMRTGKKYVSSANIADGGKTNADNNQTRAYGSNKNDRDNKMSRTDNKYGIHEEALRNEANIRKSGYLRRNDRNRGHDEMGADKENSRNLDKLQEAEYRPGLGAERHKYDLSDDDIETFNVDSSYTAAFGPDDSSIDQFSGLSKKTDSSDKLIKELKDKIEDRKSRMLEKTRDVGADECVAVEKLVDVSEKLPVTAGVSVGRVGSGPAPTQIVQQPAGDKETADVENSDNESDDTGLVKRGDGDDRSHGQGGQNRDTSGGRERRRGRQDEDEKRDRGRYRRNSGDSERRRGRRDEEEGVDRDRYRDIERSKRRNEDDRDRDGEYSEERKRTEWRDERGVEKSRYRGRSGERERRREWQEGDGEERDRDRYRGRSWDRERRRRQDEEEEEIDRRSYRGRSGERERRRGRRDEEEETDRERHRGGSMERERRRGRRDEEEEIDRERHRGGSRERERTKERRDVEEEIDRDRYRGRSGERERKRGRQDEEEMDRDRYRGRSGDRERRRRRRDDEEEVDRDHYKGRSGERERRMGRRDEEEEIDTDRYRGKSDDRERRKRRDNEERTANDRQRGKSAERERRVKRGYEEEGEAKFTVENEDKYKEKGRRDKDRLTSDDERRRRKRDEQLDESIGDISVDSTRILELDDSLRDRAGHLIEVTDDRNAEKEHERDQIQKRKERTEDKKNEDKSGSSRKPVNRDDFIDLTSTSQVKSVSREDTRGVEQELYVHKTTEKTNVDNVTESLSKIRQEPVNHPDEEIKEGHIRVETVDNRIQDSKQRNKKEHTESERRTTKKKDKWKPEEKKLDDRCESVKEIIQSSKIAVLQQAADTSPAGSRRSADSSPHVSGSRPPQADLTSGHTALNARLPGTDSLEITQPGDLRQASKKVSTVIVTDLNEGFDSVPHLAGRKDLRTDVDLHSTDGKGIHEDKVRKPENVYETAYISTETVKTDLGVSKARKSAARHNKYSKDIGKDRQERRFDSTGDRPRITDLEIPEMLMTNDSIYDQHKVTEIPEILNQTDNIYDQNKVTMKVIPEILIKKNNIHDKVTEKDIPEILPMKDKNEKRPKRQKYSDKDIPEVSLTKVKDNRYQDVGIPEISSAKAKTVHRHWHKHIESPEIKSVDKAKDRQKYTKKDITEIQFVSPSVKEPVESFLTVDKKSDTSHKVSGVIVTDLDEGFDSVHHSLDKNKKAVIDHLVIDENRAHGDEGITKSINDYETIFISSETVETDLGVLKTSADFVSARYKYSKDTGKDRQERRHNSAGNRHRTQDVDIPEISVSRDTIDDKHNVALPDIPEMTIKKGTIRGQHKVTEKEIPEISIKRENIDVKRKVTEKYIPEISFRKENFDVKHNVTDDIPKTSIVKENLDVKHKITEKGIPEIQLMKDKTGNRQGYRDKEIPELYVKKDTAARRERHQQFPEVLSVQAQPPAVEVLKYSPAKISARAPRALPEDDESVDEKVDMKKDIQETDIDQEVEIGQANNKKDLVDVKKTSELGINKDTKAATEVYNEAEVKTDTYKGAFDPEVYKQIKARSLAYKENLAKPYASQAKVSSESSKGETKGDSKHSTYKEDSKRFDTHKVDSKRSDTHKDDSKRSDTYKDDSKRSDTYKEDSKCFDSHKEVSKRSDAYKDDSKRSDAYKDDSKRSDTHKEDSKRSDTHKDDSKRSDIHKEDSKRSDTHKEDSKHSTYKEDSKRSDIHKKDSKRFDTHKGDSKHSTYKEDSNRFDTHKDDSKRSDTYKEDSNRFDTHKDDSKCSDSHKEEMVDLTVSVPRINTGDARRLLNEKVIKDADNKIQKKTRSDVHELGIRLPENQSYRLVSETVQPTEKAPAVFQHIQSPEIKVSKALDVCTAPTTYEVTKPATAGISKPITAEVIRTAKDEVIRPAKAEVTRTAKDEVTRTAKDVIRPLTDEVTRTAKDEVNRTAKDKVTRPAKDEVMRPAKVEVTKPAKSVTAEVTRPTKPATEVAKPATTEVTKPATTEVTKPATTEVTKFATGEVTRPAEAVAVGSTSDSHITADKTKGVHQDGGISSPKNLEDVRNRTPESSQLSNRKVDRTQFVKRTGAGGLDYSEDTSNETRKDSAYKGTSGQLSKVANETTSRLGRGSGRWYPADRDNKKLAGASRLRPADVGDKKTVDKRDNWADRSTDVDATVGAGGEVGRQLPARGSMILSDINVQDVSVQGDKGNVDKRFFKRELSLELASEAAARAGNRSSKQLSPRSEPEETSPEVSSVSKDTNEVRKPNTDTRTRSVEKVPETSVRSKREAERPDPVRENVRSLSEDVFDDRESQQHKDSRTRPPKLVPRANQAEVEAADASPVRTGRRMSPEDVFDDNKSQQHQDSRTRPPKLVPRANQARVEVAEAHPVRRNDRVVSAADISNRDTRRPQQDSRTRSSQPGSQPPSNRSWRSASEADVPKENKCSIESKARASSPEPDWTKSQQMRDTEDWNMFDDHELAEAVVRPQEKQKYAGFVKRTGRGARKSLPLRGVSLEGEDQALEKQPDDRLDELKKEHTHDDVSKLVSQKDEPSEGIIRDHFSTVVHENPIEVKVDNDDSPPQPSPKKGIFSFFGCVASKSVDLARMLDRSKKKRPTAYYEEGEKRKIKKLSKEKEKEEKKVLYFEKTEEEEASESYETDSSFRTSDGEFSDTAPENPPPLPVVEEKPLQGYGSVRYQNRPPPLQTIKPLSTFIDPSEALEALGGSASEEEEGSPTFAGRKKRPLDDDSLRGGQFQTFMSFGKSSIGPSIARPRFGYRSPDSDSGSKIVDAEATEGGIQQPTEVEKTSMTQLSDFVRGDDIGQDGHSEDNVQLRSKTSDPVNRRSNIPSRSSVRRSGASQRVSAEARLSDFISNLPPPSFDPDAAPPYDVSFPPPPEKLETSSSSSML